MMRQKTYVLAKAILERKDILFGNSSENVLKPQILKEKEDAWESVRSEMIEQGFTNFERKSWRDVRNHDWQYLRRSAVAKYEHNQKNGVEPLPYTEVDKIVFEIMGNEVPPSSSQYDFPNGSINFNWLKSDDQQPVKSDAFDSSQIGISPSFVNEASFNAEQQQFNSILSSALVASASMLSRKMSWETCSPAESPKDTQKQQRSLLQFQPTTQNNDEVIALSQQFTDIPNRSSNAELLQSIIAASSLSTTTMQNNSEQNGKHNLEHAEPRPPVSSGIITSTFASTRKRPHSQSSLAGRSVEDEIHDAKLRLILLQVKREEIILQQEETKLLQEEAKLRQEQTKIKILERQLQATTPE